MYLAQNYLLFIFLFRQKEYAFLYCLLAQGMTWLEYVVGVQRLKMMLILQIYWKNMKLVLRVYLTGKIIFSFLFLFSRGAESIKTVFVVFILFSYIKDYSTEYN